MSSTHETLHLSSADLDRMAIANVDQIERESTAEPDTPIEFCENELCQTECLTGGIYCLYCYFEIWEELKSSPTPICENKDCEKKSYPGQKKCVECCWKQ